MPEFMKGAYLDLGKGATGLPNACEPAVKVLCYPVVDENCSGDDRCPLSV
jgi:hypothetical protein